MLKAALGAMTKEKQRLEYFVSTSKAVFARQSGVLEMACDNWGLIYKRQMFSTFRAMCKAQRRRREVYSHHMAHLVKRFYHTRLLRTCFNRINTCRFDERLEKEAEQATVLRTRRMINDCISAIRLESQELDDAKARIVMEKASITLEISRLQGAIAEVRQVLSDRSAMLEKIEMQQALVRATVRVSLRSHRWKLPKGTPAVLRRQFKALMAQEIPPGVSRKKGDTYGWVLFEIFRHYSVWSFVQARALRTDRARRGGRRDGDGRKGVPLRDPRGTASPLPSA